MKILKHTGIGLFGLAFTLFGLSEVKQGTTAQAKTYIVAAGKHDFKPNDFPLPYFSANEYEAIFSLSASCWWSIEDQDYRGGKDIYDWNKLGGMTNYLTGNAKQSVLFAWRPAADQNYFEITSYINPRKGKFETGPVVSIPIDSSVYTRIRWYGSKVLFEYGDTSVWHPIKKPFMIRKLGPWFGGNQKAHQDMQLSLESHVH